MVQLKTSWPKDIWRGSVTDDCTTRDISEKTFWQKAVGQHRPKQFAFLLVLA